MKTRTKVLIGAGAAGVAGFILWRLYAAGKKVGDGDLIVPDAGWEGWDTTTNDGNGATFGPSPIRRSNLPTEEYAQPSPIGTTMSEKTTSSGREYSPAGKGAAVVAALRSPSPPIGTEPNMPFGGASPYYTDPCAGVVCPPNHVCGGGFCYPIE